MEAAESMDRAPEAARLEAELAEVCGVLNAATGRMVGLIGDVLATGAWTGAGIRSPEQWVAWQCGVSPGRARSLVAMAGRLPELPAATAAFSTGELSEDQVRVLCRHRRHTTMSKPPSWPGIPTEPLGRRTARPLRRFVGSPSGPTRRRGR